MSDRPVATDALETLGEIIDDNQKRDAIHLAVEPVRAGTVLAPGQHIRVKDGVAYPTAVGEGFGIVDPFLRAHVQPGDGFWFVMYPRMVHSLRHVWTHPAFPDEMFATKQPSTAEAWLRAHADEMGLSYGKLMELADEWLANKGWDGYYVEQGSDHMRDTFDPEHFWEHWSAVTGRTVPQEKRESFFSCSC